MTKLPKKVTRDLELVLLDLKRAAAFLAKDTVAVCHKGGHATTTLHMTRKMDGEIFYEINKHIGSNLTGLQEGIRKLEQMLAPEEIAEMESLSA